MASRKPPSQRPERQMDDAAKAIARLKETADAEKSKQSERAEKAKAPTNRLAKAVPTRNVGAQPVYPSTKRPKKV